MPHDLVLPILALVLWSLVMWIWMYATRIPAMQKAKIDPQEAVKTRTLALPPNVMWPADNYNHLMEQPTIFYATALAASVAGVESEAIVALAWTYVALRVLHSLVQATVNIVVVRFAIFVISTLALAGMALLTLAAVLAQ